MNNMLYRKVKETEDKMKEKCYELKDKIDQFISHAKYKIHCNRKLDRAGNYISIAIGLFILTASWLTATQWLLWIGAASILSNACLLIIKPVKIENLKKAL
ncbi:hypothetical protein ACDX77_04760 [Bacillus velezensis]|uniref:hypothetical protein n=1 Tax=Bacillus amyloliquefaciens group TaxID=1938374 RepID=UPI0007A5F5AD|nr:MULTISPECIES: hypothetical protein [Bacillus amyloliquefaciens group]QCT30063.1 hypothetical protein D1120_09465 [Bacillus velezensis]